MPTSTAPEPTAAPSTEKAGLGVVLAAIVGALILSGVLLVSAASAVGWLQACSTKTVERASFSDDAVIPDGATTVPTGTEPGPTTSEAVSEPSASTLEKETTCGGVGMQSAVVVLGGILGGTLLLPLLVGLMPDGAEGAVGGARLKGRSGDKNVRQLVEETLILKQTYDDRVAGKSEAPAPQTPRRGRAWLWRRKPATD